MAKKCMKLFPEILPVLKVLSKEDAGTLFGALAELFLGGRESPVPDRLLPVFVLLRTLLEEQEQDRANGRKGGRPRKVRDAAESAEPENGTAGVAADAREGFTAGASALEAEKRAAAGRKAAAGAALCPEEAKGDSDFRAKEVPIPAEDARRGGDTADEGTGSAAGNAGSVLEKAAHAEGTGKHAEAAPEGAAVSPAPASRQGRGIPGAVYVACGDTPLPWDDIPRRRDDAAAEKQGHGAGGGTRFPTGTDGTHGFPDPAGRDKPPAGMTGAIFSRHADPAGWDTVSGAGQAAGPASENGKDRPVPGGNSACAGPEGKASGADNAGPEEKAAVSGSTVLSGDDVTALYRENGIPLGNQALWEMQSWLEKGMDRDLLKYACERAVANNCLKWSYCWGILRNLYSQGVRRLSDVKPRPKPAGKGSGFTERSYTDEDMKKFDLSIVPGDGGAA